MSTDQGDVMARLEAKFAEPEVSQTTDDTEEEVTELETEQDVQAGEEPEEKQEVEEEQSEESLTTGDLAEYLGVDQDKLTVGDDGEVFIKTKIDGKEGKAKLDDLIKSYQLEGHLNSKNMEASELRKSLDAESNELKETYKGKLSQAEDLIKLAMSELNSDFEKIDWKELEAEDDIEYIKQTQKFEARQRKLAKKFEEIQAAKDVDTVDRQEEINSLIKKIPTWADDAVADKEYKSVTDYMKTQGYSAKDIKNLDDHKTVVMARKAMMFDGLDKNRVTVKDKVRKAPKLVRAGSPKGKDQLGKESVNKARLKVKKGGGKTKDIASLLLASGKI